MFLQMNRNKKSLTLNPGTEKGREVIRKLVESADVVIANLPGETLKTMGLDWDTVSRVNPRAILAVVSAFGLDGPYANRVGFDGVAQAMSGASYFAGTEDQPVRSAAPYVDFGTASLMAMGVMAALRSRDQTGKGQTGRRRLAAHRHDLFQPDADRGRRDCISTASRRSTAARPQAPATSTRPSDGWITVAVNGDPLFRRVCRLIGAEEWIADPRFASDKARGDNGAIISERVGAWVANAPARTPSPPSKARACRPGPSTRMARRWPTACAGQRHLHRGRFSRHRQGAGSRPRR